MVRTDERRSFESLLEIDLLLTAVKSLSAVKFVGACARSTGHQTHALRSVGESPFFDLL